MEGAVGCDKGRWRVEVGGGGIGEEYKPSGSLEADALHRLANFPHLNQQAHASRDKDHVSGFSPQNNSMGHDTQMSETYLTNERDVPHK